MRLVWTKKIIKPFTLPPNRVPPVRRIFSLDSFSWSVKRFSKAFILGRSINKNKFFGFFHSSARFILTPHQLTDIIIKAFLAGVAELADAQDLKSCEVTLVPVRSRSPAPSAAWSRFVLQAFFIYRKRHEILTGIFFVPFDRISPNVGFLFGIFSLKKNDGIVMVLIVPVYKPRWDCPIFRFSTQSAARFLVLTQVEKRH